MKNTNRGFTLIELLVVVLIVGILAAVAVPQYQKAVEKSKLAGIWSNLGTIRRAAQTAMFNPENSEDITNWNPGLLDASVVCTGGSKRLCSTPCPTGGWSNCKYYVEGEPTNPLALFMFEKGDDTVYITLDNAGQKCYGAKCSLYGLTGDLISGGMYATPSVSQPLN